MLEITYLIRTQWNVFVDVGSTKIITSLFVLEVYLSRDDGCQLFQLSTASNSTVLFSPDPRPTSV